VAASAAACVQGASITPDDSSEVVESQGASTSVNSPSCVVDAPRSSPSASALAGTSDDDNDDIPFGRLRGGQTRISPSSVVDAPQSLSSASALADSSDSENNDIPLSGRRLIQSLRRRSVESVDED